MEPLLSFEGDCEKEEVLDHRKFILHKYMCRVYQYVDKSHPAVTARNIFCRRMMQVLFTILIWFCFGYKLMSFAITFYDNARMYNTFERMVLVLIKLVWMLRYVLLHNMGLYILMKYPNEAIHIVAKLTADTETDDQNRSLITMVKEKQKLVYRIMTITLCCVTVIPAIRTLVPMIVETKSTGQYSIIGVMFLEILVLFYTRIVALPCFFYIIYVANLQRVQIRHYHGRLQLSSKPPDDLFKDYVKIQQSIETFAQNVQSYLSMLILLLFLWGSLTAFNTVSMLKDISNKVTSENTSLDIYNTFANFIVFTVEVMLLFSLPWFFLNKVAREKQKLISWVLEIQYSKNQRESYTFKTFENVWLLAKRIERHQRFLDPGYKAFGLNVTTLRIVWLSLLAPALLFLATAIMKGKI